MAASTSAPRISASHAASRRVEPDRSSGGTLPHNVANAERIGSVAIGAALIAYGLRRRDVGGVAAAFIGGAFVQRGATGRCAVYDALGVSTGDAEAVLDRHRDDVTSRAATVNARKAVKVERSVTIARPRHELYAFWRNFTNLPHIMQHLKAVRVDSPTRSHWTAKAPAGGSVEWEAEIVNDVPDEIIAWKSVGNADVDNAGAVNFSDAPSGQGTVVRVTLDYEPPGGKFGAMIARLFGEDPDRQVHDDLQKFKQLMEGGGVPSASRRGEGPISAEAVPPR